MRCMENASRHVAWTECHTQDRVATEMAWPLNGIRKVHEDSVGETEYKGRRE